MDKVRTTSRQAQILVWTATYIIRVVVVLTVILPKADGANVISSALGQRDEPAARARVWAVTSPHNVRHLSSVTPKCRGAPMTRRSGTA